MALLLFLILVAVVHCAIYFFDTMFRSCQHVPYLYFLQNCGIQVLPFQLRCFTGMLNRVFQKWGTWRPRLLRIWFAVGAWISVALVIPSMIVLVYTLVANFQRGNSQVQDSPIVLQPVVPGVNIPTSDIGHYLLSLLACSVVHEFGHAVAAVREDVPVIGFGFLLFFILPAAYVELNAEKLQNLSPERQLRILCAGVWHNIVLAVTAMALLFAMPYIFLATFHHSKGVTIWQISENSPVLGPTGLEVGDHILRMNQCPVHNLETWHQCLSKTSRESPQAFCISSELVHQYDESVPVRQLPRGSVECCSASSPNHLCFEYLEHEKNAAVLPQYTCLPVRTVVERAFGLCEVSSDCLRESHCLRPSLDNYTRLLQVKRRQRSDVLFLGNPAEVYYTVHVSNYVPKYSWISSVVPEIVETLCKYIIAFSGALAVLNIIPCYGLDGQHVVRALIDLLFIKRMPNAEVRSTLCAVVTCAGTLLVAVNVIVGIFSLL